MTPKQLNNNRLKKKELPVRYKQRFSMNGFSVHFEILGEDILYTRSSGILRPEHVEPLFTCFERVLYDGGLQQKGYYYHIGDWSGMEKSDWAARKGYIDNLNRIDKKVPCRYSAIIGLNPLMQIIVSVSKRFIPFAVDSANSFQTALSMLEIKKGVPHSEQFSKSEKEEVAHIKHVDQQIDRLLRFMESISWATESLITTKIDKTISPQFRPLFESLTLIKNDFDAILREKGEVEKNIAEHNHFNKTRTEIWKIASEKSLSADELIEKLLNIVGQAIGLSRACYNSYMNDDPYSDLLCTIEWCDEGVSPSLGTKIPSFLVKQFVHKGAFHLTPDKASSMVPKLLRGITKALILAITRPLNIESFSILPHYVDDKLLGWFTFDICRDNPHKPEMTEETRDVIREMIDIAANHIAQKQAEDALQTAYNEMEDRVVERTMELAKTNIQLQQEVRERKKMEEIFQVSEKKYRTLFNHIADPVYIFDKHSYQFLDCNDAVLRVYGYTYDQLNFMTLFSLYQDDEKKQIREYIKHSPQSEPVTFTHITAKGIKMAVEIIMDEIEYHGKPAWMKIVCDVTKRKEAEEALRKAKELAEAANLAKSQFLANISHEMRTPLNAIIGFSEIILGSKSVRKIHNQAKIILHESESLMHLINTLLDQAKIEAGKMEIESRAVDLHLFMEQVSRIVRGQAMIKGLNFKLDLDKNVLQYVEIDPMRLRQILFNLLGNAVKFTNQGTVSLKVQSNKKLSNHPTLLFTVEDTGIGIPKDKHATIFKSFLQVDGSTTRKYGGTGLGTTIARQLVELMGGEIGMESQLGKGSQFWFTLPCIQSRSRPQAEDLISIIDDLPFRVDQSENQRAGSILIAEDYSPNQEVVRLHLNGVGHKVKIVEDGEQAVKMCSRQEFDIILMDVQMPIMDGYEATRQIRSLSPYFEKVPILALTAHAGTSVRDACRKAGMNDVITKPIRRNLLISTIDMWLGVMDSKVGEGLKGQYFDRKTCQDPNSHNPINYRIALEEFEDEAVLSRVLNQFLMTVEKQIAVMEKALKKGQTDAIQKEAHAIKGGASTLEALPLTKTAKALEDVCKKNDPEKIGDLLNQLRHEFKRLKEYTSDVLKYP